MITSQVYRKQNFGRRMGFGESMALLIIDFQRGFADPEQFGGFNIVEAIANTEVLLSECRRASIPVAHVSFQVQDDACDLGPFGLKVPSLAKLTAGSDGVRIVDGLTPAKGEFLSIKQHASAFFGTALATWLSARRIDTLLITGCTTSGCVRASAVDASAYGFRPIVVEECVGDRAEEPHRANLFDIEQKYGDVVPLAEVIQRVRDHGPAISTVAAA